MNPTLSVIIPVYKVENYLERCVKSVLNQDYRDLEVILVDDGSPDRCPLICDELAKTDERVYVIHKSNGGLSSARNEGIDAAKGEYIAFLDSDDQWAPNQLSLLMDQVVITEAQMVLFSSKSLYENNSRLYKREDILFLDERKKCLTAQELYPILIQSGNLHESACTKIVRTSFLRDNNLTFKSGILGEDTEWFFRVLRKEFLIRILNISLFICTENRGGSISNTASSKSVNDTLSTIQSSIEYYKRNPSVPTKYYELAHCAYLWSIALGLYTNVLKTDKKSVRQGLVKIVSKLDLTSHPKSKRVGQLYNFFGFSITAFILHLYIKLHRKNLINKKNKVNE